MRIIDRWVAGMAALGLLGIVGCGGRVEGNKIETPELVLAVPAGGEHGPISGPFHHWQSKWESETGARLKIIEIPIGELASRVAQDLDQGAGAFDAFVVPAYFQGEWLTRDAVLPVDDYFHKPGFPQWQKESVLAPAASLLTWQKQWLFCPFDHDADVLYFREDVLTDPKFKEEFAKRRGKSLKVPPRTWDELCEICDFFVGRDWNGNGESDDFGVSLHGRADGWAGWAWLDVAAPYVVSSGPNVHRHYNVFYLDPETLEPLVDSPGHAKGFKMLRRLRGFASPSASERGRDEAWSEFLGGKSLFCFGGGELAKLAQDPDRSSIKGKLGCAALPGSLEVWSLRDSRWKSLSRPNLVTNTNGANWHGVIRRGAAKADLAYHLFAFHANRIASMENVGALWSGVEPGRSFQLIRPEGEATVDDYARFGFNEHDAREYLHAVHENAEKTNARIEYLRIPGAARIHAAIDQAASTALRDPGMPAEQICSALVRNIREILIDVSRQIGADRLEDMHRRAIGYQASR